MAITRSVGAVDGTLPAPGDQGGRHMQCLPVFIYRRSVTARPLAGCVCFTESPQHTALILSYLTPVARDLSAYRCYIVLKFVNQSGWLNA